ncbi:MAG: polyvinylalcohol dehydrogenase [Planctomycetaceae bacterium]|nr:polyvinylalcohol dehydrogenase [Planctomycetaceae bacterium]
MFRAIFAIVIVTSWTVSAFAEPDWNQWRGPQRNGKSTETGLSHDWTVAEPELIWQSKGLGKGYSSIAISDGRIFTLGFLDDKEHLIGLSLENGARLWTVPFGDGDHSNGTPTVDEDRVYAVGLNGDLICADVITGREIWRKSFSEDYGGKMMSGWGYSESPLIDGDHLICTPGAADAVIVALDKHTGETLWKSKAPAEPGPKGKDGAGYSSIVISNACGEKQYIQLTGRGIIGVRASDGELLWHYNTIANDVANIPTPVIWDDFVFCSTGYGTGAALLKIQREGDALSAEEVYFLDANVFQNHHGGMIRVGDHLYAGHKHNQGFPICLELTTGNVVWGGNKRGPGTGSAAIVFADEHLIFRYQNGVVALIEATPTEYKLKGEFAPAFQDGNSWAHPVVYQGKLYLREQDSLMCYDIAETP